LVLLLKNILFTVFVPGVVAVYIPLRVVARPAPIPLSDWRIWQMAALIPLSLGAAIYFWCLWDFATKGGGTPAPIDAPKRLVAHGLYKYTRNPMYIGVLLIIAGWAVFFQSRQILIYGAAVAVFFHLFVLLVEEPMLKRKFGESYVAYCKDVRRWLPKLRRKQTA
jgi:protein-S-isoprenylcysteine O-methyltransferase Ste14